MYMVVSKKWTQRHGLDKSIRQLFSQWFSVAASDGSFNLDFSDRCGAGLVLADCDIPILKGYFDETSNSASSYRA